MTPFPGTATLECALEDAPEGTLEGALRGAVAGPAPESEEEVAGDLLAGYLRSTNPLPARVRVAPPPRSWAALKPSLIDALNEVGARGDKPPELVGMPLCGGGADFRALPVAPRPHGDAPAPCGGCARRPLCSPPESWSHELSPFGPSDPGELFGAWHARLAAALGEEADPRLARAVRAHLASIAATHADAPATLEPSVTFGAGLERATRLAIFHGKLPTGTGAARAAMAAQLRGFLAMHDAIGAPRPRALAEVLLRAGPLQAPVGFDARPSAPPSLKVYVRLQDRSPRQRAALLVALRPLVASGWSTPQAEELARGADMLGVSTVHGRVAVVKAYIPADPAAGWPDVGLPAIVDTHPFVSLSRQRAYAVVDLAGPTRQPKWDFFLREPLLSPALTLDLLSRIASPPAAAQARGLLDHQLFRSDVVAGALRGDQVTLYLDLS
jgi:hypothetical protein